jgi:predicted dehydrogenase
MDFHSRRNFLGAAGAAIWTAKSYAQVIGSNSRLRIGVIGCGGMAGHHMKTLVKVREKDNIDFAAVCDVYDKRAEAAAQLTGGKVIKDYRRLLDEKLVDYVLIATPEHWHARMTMDALDAGKHIYCEKPMTRTIDESKKVIEAARRHPNLKLQIGVQGMSDNSYETANEYVKQGALGKVVLAQIDYSRNHTGDFYTGAPDPDAKPGVNLDWKSWLGGAKKRDFDPDRYFAWRRYWDYSSGIVSDLFVHRATRIIKALGLTFPERVVSTGGQFAFAGTKAEIPDTVNVLADYPGGPTMQLISSMANDTKVEHLLRGHKATLEFTSAGFKITPQRDFAKEAKPVEFKKTGAENVELHHRNLHDAIRNGAALKCDSMLGFYGVVVCMMAVESYRKQEYLRWDASKQKAVRA